MSVNRLIVQALADGDMGFREIAEVIGNEPETVRRKAHALSQDDRPRLIHIAKWDRHGRVTGGGYPTPVYRLGDGRNAPRPAPKTHTQSAREYMQRAQRLAQTVLCAGVPQKKAAKIVSGIRKRNTEAKGPRSGPA